MLIVKAFGLLGLIGVALATDCISNMGNRCMLKSEMNTYWASLYETGEPCFLSESGSRLCFTSSETNMQEPCTCYAECGCKDAPVVPSCDNSAVPKDPDCSADKATYCTPSLESVSDGVTYKNTMCEYCGVDLAACDKVCARLLTEEEKKAIVDKHNELRRKVAQGLENQGVDGPQPKAADMFELTWDETLAASAQRWVDQCQSGHDKARAVPEFGSVGQNAASGSSLTGAVESWYSEVSLFQTSSVDSMVWGTGETGHYTQVVWGSTQKVGCGFIRYRKGSGGISQVVVCNYGPAGNLPGAKVYTQGETASACPNGDNEGLCKQ